MLIIDMLGFFQNYSHIHVFKFVLYPRKVVRDGVRVDKIKGGRNLPDCLPCLLNAIDWQDLGRN